jgi:hypothetical protein
MITLSCLYRVLGFTNDKERTGWKTHKPPTENASEIVSFLRTGRFIPQSRVTGTIAMAMSSPRLIASRATNEGISSHEDDGSHAADIG